MDQDEISLTIEELSEQTQTPVRTVRYYIAEDLLPGPGSRGKGASYTEEHLLRLRLIRRLTERRAPLAEIREVMARVTPDEIRALLAEEDARSEALERAERSVSPKEYITALLDQARTPHTPSSPKPGIAQAGYARSGQLGQSGLGGQASAWRRVELAPGVELHIQTATEKRYKRLIERLLQVSDEELHRQ